MPPRKSFLSRFRKSVPDAPEQAARMRHIDATFFGGDEDEEEGLFGGRKEGAGMPITLLRA